MVATTGPMGRGLMHTVGRRGLVNINTGDRSYKAPSHAKLSEISDQVYPISYQKPRKNSRLCL